MFSSLWLNYDKSKTDFTIKSIEYSQESSIDFQYVENELALAFQNNDESGARLRLLWDSTFAEEEFAIDYKEEAYELKAKSERGFFYAVAKFIRLGRLGKLDENIRYRTKAAIPLRMIDHWDNMDGSIERGYAGQSFFFENHEIIINERTVHYARLLASIGINAVCFNNVNVVNTATELISERYYEDLNQLFTVFQNYGVKPYLSLNFASPIELGGLDSADPLDERVIAWWDAKMDETFTKLPQLAGFVVKADSEGRPGPFTYGRNQAEGANMLAKAVRKHQGTIIWRAFVYNCRQDWRDHQTDRARAAYDYFSPLDGAFDDNVFLQIKNGPMDFQVLEPVSPLFFALPKTNLILEFQIAQEYTGQQIDLCYLLPMWQDILNFPGEHLARHDVKTRIMQPRAGIAAVANTGNDYNWCGHYLAAANFYGYGELAWDPSVDAKLVAEEFLRLSFAIKEGPLAQTVNMMMQSWQTMEKYTAPLGIGWMVTPHYHYAPNIDGYEYSMWGTYHRADHYGIGIDRTKQGTAYASTYPEKVAAMYEHLETCPDELLLFFHHVPYTHVLKSGKTVIQHIYDSHFEGYEEVEAFVATWDGLEGKIDEEVFLHTQERFARQLANAREWRDQINIYFYRLSQIEDVRGRTIYR